jgi:hypothetical protein
VSTEFRNRSALELGFVRFYGGPRRKACYEFGTMTNFEHVCKQMRAGDQYGPYCGEELAGDPESAGDLEELLMQDRVTFGEMGITVEVGSGDAWRFTVEE